MEVNVGGWRTDIWETRIIQNTYFIEPRTEEYNELLFNYLRKHLVIFLCTENFVRALPSPFISHLCHQQLMIAHG
jgi:hypothetical protein